MCSNVWIDYVMGPGLEQEDGSLITPMALAHSVHPMRSSSRNKRRNLCGFDDELCPDDLGPGP